MKPSPGVAIITGASSGLGREMARLLSDSGWHVGLVARSVEPMQETTDAIRAKGGTATFREVDIQKRSEVLTQLKSIETELGPCNRLIVNAGTGATNHPDNLNIDGAERVIQTNLLGAIYTIEAILPGMLQRNHGHIIGISSLAAHKGLPGAAAYCASKAALSSYIESLRIQLHATKVKFTTVFPGFIDTPMTKKQKGMMFLMNVEEGAKRILYGIDRQKKVWNFPWITTRLMKLTYWLPDWLLAKILIDDFGGSKEGKQ